MRRGQIYARNEHFPCIETGLNNRKIPESSRHEARSHHERNGQGDLGRQEQRVLSVSLTDFLCRRLVSLATQRKGGSSWHEGKVG